MAALKPRLSEGRIPFQLGLDTGVAPPVVELPYQGDAYIYDSAGATGTVTGGTILDGPNQSSPTGSVTGGTIQPGPNQSSATGSISGGTVLPSDTIYD